MKKAAYKRGESHRKFIGDVVYDARKVYPFLARTRQMLMTIIKVLEIYDKWLQIHSWDKLLVNYSMIGFKNVIIVYLFSFFPLRIYLTFAEK